MLIGLGRFTVRWRKAILVGAAVFVVASFVIAGGVADKLTARAASPTRTSESERAAGILRARVRSLDPNVVLLVTAKDGTVDDAAVAAAGAKITEELPTSSATPSRRTGAGQRAAAREPRSPQALVLGVIAGSDDHVDDVIKTSRREFTRDNATVTVAVGGRGRGVPPGRRDDQVRPQRAESIALPITLILLVIVFGSLVAAGAAAARRRRRDRRHVPRAVRSSRRSPTCRCSRSTSPPRWGSASRSTTACSSSPATARSCATGSSRRRRRAHGRDRRAHGRCSRADRRGVARRAAACSRSVLPALVRLRRHRGRRARRGSAPSSCCPRCSRCSAPGSNSGRIFRHREPKPRRRAAFWHRRRDAVMRRPVPVAPGRHRCSCSCSACRSSASPSACPTTGCSRRTCRAARCSDQIREHFTSQEAGALQVVAPDARRSARPTPRRSRRTPPRCRQLHGVARVDALPGSYVDGQAIAGPLSGHRALRRRPGHVGVRRARRSSRCPPPASSSSHEIRRVPSPVGAVLVGGPSAQLVDSKASLSTGMPLAAGAHRDRRRSCCCSSCSGSVVVPVKALVLNMLSLTATFGAMVWIFQDGHLAGPARLHADRAARHHHADPDVLRRVRPVDGLRGVPALAHQGGARPRRATTRRGRARPRAHRPDRHGGGRSLAVVFLAFATSGVTSSSCSASGLALAVLDGRVVIRGTLVPAFMRLAGRGELVGAEAAPHALRAVRHPGIGARRRARPSRG